MRYLKDIGFVIKKINFSESDRFIVLFTKNHGKIEVLAKGTRKITSKRLPRLELFNLISFQAIKTSKGLSLQEVELLDAAEDLKTSFGGIKLIFFLCELIDSLCPYNEPNEKVFYSIKNFIQNLDKKNVRKSIFDFEREILLYLGFLNRERKFKDYQELNQFIEGIIERKLKTEILLK